MYFMLRAEAPLGPFSALSRCCAQTVARPLVPLPPVPLYQRKNVRIRKFECMLRVCWLSVAPNSWFQYRFPNCCTSPHLLMPAGWSRPPVATLVKKQCNLARSCACETCSTTSQTRINSRTRSWSIVCGPLTHRPRSPLGPPSHNSSINRVLCCLGGF